MHNSRRGMRGYVADALGKGSHYRLKGGALTCMAGAGAAVPCASLGGPALVKVKRELIGVALRAGLKSEGGVGRPKIRVPSARQKCGVAPNPAPP